MALANTFFRRDDDEPNPGPVYHVDVLLIRNIYLIIIPYGYSKRGPRILLFIISFIILLLSICLSIYTSPPP